MLFDRSQRPEPHSHTQNHEIAPCIVAFSARYAMVTKPNFFPGSIKSFIWVPT